MSSIVAFQNSLPVTHSPGRAGVREWQVLTDPNNLVQIEKRKSVTDRVALEELYMLSLTAQGQTAIIPKRKAKIKKRTLSPNQTTAIARLEKKRPTRSSSELRALRSETADSGEDIDSALLSLPEELHISETMPDPANATSHPQFKGLTTKPNRRNLHKLSLTTKSPVIRNPTLRQELLEEIGDHNIESAFHDEEINLRFSQQAVVASTDSPTALMSKMKSRSSTMPGFKERADTLRQRRYRDGIKLATERSGTIISESDDDRRKRRQANGEYMYKTAASVPDSLVNFANQLHDIDRITPLEEVELGEKTQEAIKLQKIYDGLVTKLDREPTDDEWCAAAGKINMEAIVQAIDEGLQAKNKLVISNLRMVQGVVNVYIRNGLKGQYNAGDMMQDGIMVSNTEDRRYKIGRAFLSGLTSVFCVYCQALIRAAEKFDPSRGFRFSTYAMYWIRSAVKRDLLSQSRIIQVPSRIFEQHKKLEKSWQELKLTHDRTPTMLELSDVTGLTQAQIERCEETMNQKIYSLDQSVLNALNPFEEDANRDTLYEIIARKTEDLDTSRMEYRLLREDLIKALHQHLSEEEANLLMLRYGIIENRESMKKSGFRTVAEVSRMAGLKPDKARRLLHRSLTRLQTVMGDEWLEYERELEAGFN
jgi:RNA polymerase sigma factor (sigma-70 family)